MSRLFIYPLFVIILLIVLFLTGCQSDAKVASYNLSKAADQFEVDRRVVFYDSIQGTYLLTIEGKCSIEADRADNQLEVTCKVGANEYKKHFLGLADNVTYFAEQIKTMPASTYRYRVVFKPSVIIPDIEMPIGEK